MSADPEAWEKAGHHRQARTSKEARAWRHFELSEGTVEVHFPSSVPSVVQ
jgi:hypothetical protein